MYSVYASSKEAAVMGGGTTGIAYEVGTFHLVYIVAMYTPPVPD